MTRELTDRHDDVITSAYVSRPRDAHNRVAGMHYVLH